MYQSTMSNSHGRVVCHIIKMILHEKMKKPAGLAMFTVLTQTGVCLALNVTYVSMYDVSSIE